jgi:hypothetical protein
MPKFSERMWVMLKVPFWRRRAVRRTRAGIKPGMAFIVMGGLELA